jgi:uncharacterized protein (TIGR02246 family)
VTSARDVAYREEMKALVLSVSLLAAIAGLAYASQQAAGGSASSTQRLQDERTLNGIILHLESSWNSRSGQRYAEHFAPEGQLVLMNGVVAVGQQAIAGGQDAALRLIFGNSRTKASVKQLRLTSKDSAVALVHWDLKYRLTHDRDAPYMSTIAFSRAEGKWQIDSLSMTPISQ